MIYGIRHNKIYVSQQFQDWGAGERLEDYFIRTPVRSVEELSPLTLDGILEVDGLKEAGITKVIDP